MRAFREKLLRGEQFVDLDMGLGVPEDRQAERRLADERVTDERDKSFAGRVALAFVITRDDSAGATPFEQDLRRAEDMAGGMKAHVEAAEIQRFAVAHGLRRAGEILAIADCHNG